MIYLFRKFNGQIVITAGAAAWEMFSSNGNWKHRPQYLGAVEDRVYRELKDKAKADAPIDPELHRAVNQGDKSRDGELLKLGKRRAELEQQLLDELVAVADRSVTPTNMDVVNANTLKPHERQAVRGLIGS